MTTSHLTRLSNNDSQVTGYGPLQTTICKINNDPTYIFSLRNISSRSFKKRCPISVGAMC